MAKYNITQKLNLNGNKVSTSFVFIGDDDDVAGFCSHLEGGYEVKKVDESLSNMTKADTLVTLTNPAIRVTFVGDKGLISTIRPFSGKIHFKQTSTVDEIKASIPNIKPFEALPTEKANNISIVRYE